MRIHKDSKMANNINLFLYIFSLSSFKFDKRKYI